MEWEIRLFATPEIHFGLGARNLVGQCAKKLGGNRALIVTDHNVIKAGWVDNVKDSLEEEGIKFAVYADVTPNVKDREVMSSARAYQDHACDLIVAVGGGSVIDCAKGAGVISANGGQIADYYGYEKVRAPLPKLICIQTTAGTGVDVTRYAMILDTANKIKVGVDSALLMPVVALSDPEVTVTADRYVTACAGADGLVQGIEGYVSKMHSPMADLHAMQALNETFKYLPAVIDRPDDVDLRAHVMLGHLSGGLATANSGVGLAHAMSHPVGGLYDLRHGEINLALLEYVIAFNFDEAMERYRDIAICLGIDAKRMPLARLKQGIIDAVRQFRKDIGLTKSLSELGVKRSDFTRLANNAINDFTMGTNPKKASKQDIETLYEQAFTGSSPTESPVGKVLSAVLRKPLKN